MNYIFNKIIDVVYSKFVDYWYFKPIPVNIKTIEQDNFIVLKHIDKKLIEQKEPIIKTIKFLDEIKEFHKNRKLRKIKCKNHYF
jgi:hypothetical protein